VSSTDRRKRRRELRQHPGRTTTTTDDAGRVTLQTTSVGSTFISSTATIYDGDGNAIFITNTVSQPSGGNRVTYTGNWYNTDDQLVTSVNYGTNGGTSMTSRPDTARAGPRRGGAGSHHLYLHGRGLRRQHDRPAQHHHDKHVR